jgi:3D (Asp-Asp-Asp) domain-containing protein
MKKIKKGKIKFTSEQLKHLRKILIISVLLIVLIVISVIVYSNEEKRLNNIIEEQYNNVENYLEDKQNDIDELNQKITDLEEINNQLKQKDEELTKKNNELEEQIEKLKISKTQVTSRSGTTSRSTNTSSNNTTEWITANVTAYCGCASCCGKSTGITASGTKATAGRTIAASSNYAFGTKIEIQGYGTYTVEDRGGAISGNRIDIYFNSHSEALAFGRKSLLIRVVK